MDIALVETCFEPPATLFIDVKYGALEKFNTDILVVKELHAFSHVPYFTVAVPVLMFEKPSKIIWSPEISLKNMAAEASIAVVKNEDVFHVMEAAECFYKSAEDEAKQDELLQAMRTVCCVYNKVFQNLHKMSKLQNANDMRESVNLILRVSMYIYAASKTFRKATEEFLMRKKKNCFASWQKIFIRVESSDGFFVPPNTLLSGSNVFAIVQKSRRTTLMK